MTIRHDQLDRLDQIVRHAQATGDTEKLAKARDLLARAIRQAAEDAAESRAAAREAADRADAMSRARAREEGRPRKLRKGRVRCSATRRDGERCQAPAVEGTSVCRRHGGSARQVRIAAQHFVLQMALFDAVDDWRAARGTNREIDKLGAVSRAQRELDTYEAKLARLSELRAEVASLKRGVRGGSDTAAEPRTAADGA